MKLALTTLLVSSLAFADPPADTPTSVHLEPLQPAPFSCRCLADAEHVASEKLCADDHAFRVSAEAGGAVRLTPVQLVLIVAGALAVGAGVSVGVVLATKK